MKHVARADRVSISGWRHADSARSNGAAAGGGAGTMARAFRKAGTWGWCGSGRLLDSSQHLIPSTSSPGHL